MLKAAIEKILGLAPPTQVDIDGRQYFNQGLTPVKPPVQNDLAISTLTSIADYFRDNPDSIDLKKAVVHIKSHTCVEVVSAVVGEWIQRHSYLTAEVAPKAFQYGRYLPIEHFMIAVQTHLVQDDTTAALLQVVGNITDGASVKLLDDGVTQQVEAKSGITRIENVKLPNPVQLAPYRTFLEITQPASAFVFRMKKSQGAEGPTAALYEADGGIWQLEAIKRIRDWLRTNEAIPAETIILA